MPARIDLTERGSIDLRGLQGLSVDVLVREDIKVSRAPIAAEILQTLGFDARVAREHEVDLSPDRIVLAGGNPRWYRKVLERLAALPPGRRPYLTVWHTEPLPMPAAAGLPPEPLTARELAKVVLRDRRINDHYSNARYLRLLSRMGIATVLSVATRAYQLYLEQEDIAAALVPVGYHPSDGRALHLERDIDLLFLGDYGVRRRRRVLRQLRDEGLDVLVVGSNSPEKGYWGESRTELLNRTKILLNLPRLQGHLPDFRLLVGMASGALILSEPMYAPEPYRPGVHYIESTTDEMVDTARRYLADDEARGLIAKAGQRFVTEGLTLEGSFARLMELTAARAC